MKWKLRFVSAFVLGVALLPPVVHACTQMASIWRIRNMPADPLFRFVRDGKAGYIDSSGRVVIEPSLPADDIFPSAFHEGLVAARDGQGIRRGFKYVDRSGTVVFRTNAFLAFDFSEGLASATAQFEPGRLGRWGFIDRSGEFVVPAQYRSVSSFSEGLALVNVSSDVGTAGYIDHRGTWMIPPRLSYGSSFHEGLAAVIMDGPCGMTNGGSCGRAEFAPTQPEPTYDCRYSFIDKTGRPVFDRKFDDAGAFSEGFAPVRIGGKWGFIDKIGQISIQLEFDSARSFSEGLAAVTQNGKTGFIDHSGRFAITPQFQDVSDFSDGRALVTEIGPSFRFIDKAGNAAFAGRFVDAAPFSNGLAHVEYDLGGGYRGSTKGRFAWIDTSGKAVFAYESR